MDKNKWPKRLPELTLEQKKISNEFMALWHKKLASYKRYSYIENFNHGYVVKNAPKQFVRTIEIGAGLGEHLAYEKLNPQQESNYVAVELRENMAEKIKEKYPKIKTCIGDCQKNLDFADNYFDRIIAIHVLEHLPNLPAAIKEMYRLCNKESGVFSIVIPCEGGTLYSFTRKLSAQRVFEKKYKQPYKWFIEREHINRPHEIIEELEQYFTVVHRQFFPTLLPIINLNLCIGLTLSPKPLNELEHDYT